MKTVAALFLLVPILVMGEVMSCKVFFSPEDDLADRLIECIHQENTSAKIAIYAITHLGIAKALIEAKDRGVKVEIIIDPHSMRSSALVQRLVDAKVPLFVWDQQIRIGNRKRKSLMHDKFCIFGGDKVWTGSYNFTYAAGSQHRENAVLIESRPIAQKYLTQFSHMLLYECRPYQEFLSVGAKKMWEKKSLPRYHSSLGGKK